MTGLAAAQVGLTLWSFRRPIGFLVAAVTLGPVLIGLLAAGAALPAVGTAGQLVSPLQPAELTQPFGCTSLDLEPWADDCPGHHWHSGVDLAAARGTPVSAAGAGVVTVRHDAFGYGTHVVVRHAAGVSTLYAHLEVALIADGEQVGAGQVLGRLGSTGTSTGPHLHFEVRMNDVPVDPLGVVPGLLGR